ncbi:MAG: chemotaxis protein CheB [Planctomycetes bacterium]|nr:chemotaxis protein CheB [Planctomycetota bacterium]
MRAARPSFVVGIGGSAGGLRGYLALFDALRADTGMSFIVISHILPSSTHSLLAELLAAHTRMPVQVAAEAMTIQADHVYVIPPNADLRLVDYAFRITSPRTMNRQVDIFLTSIAKAVGPLAIGIVLSGYDGDGSKACASIKALGGTTFAQDESASVTEMPRSAVASGCVDFVLPVAEMAHELHRISRRVGVH